MAGRKLIVEVVGQTQSFQTGMTRASATTKHFTSDLSKAERGALAGSGAFSAMGRSLAFASGGFLLFAGGAQLLRKSFDAAEEGDKAMRALDTTITKVGGNFNAQLPAIKKWADEQARFGVSSVQAETSLAREIELTGSAGKGMKAYTSALLISKATGKDFNAVALATGKAFDHQTTALARYIGKLPASITTSELYQRIWEKFGGQAAANTTASDRLGASLSNFERDIGSGLAPTVDHYLGSLDSWIVKMDRTGKIQSTVASGASSLATSFKAAAEAIKIVDKATGGLNNTLELLVGFKVLKSLAPEGSALLGGVGAFKGAKLEDDITGIKNEAAATLGLADAEEAATAKAVLLQRAMSRLTGPAIIVGLVALADGIKRVFDADSFFGGNTDRIEAGFKKAVAAAQQARTDAILNAQKIDNSPIPRDRLNPRVLPANETPGTNNNAKPLTTKQKETFFDNSIAQILLIGGLGSIQKQIDALHKADGLLKTRLAATNDVTRQIKLEDEIAQNEATVQQLNAQRVQQLNTIFDNSIARILLRSGLGTLAQQVAGLQKADALLTQRISVTKDITRKLNLGDELLQNQSQLSGLKQQQTDASIFNQLGLGATGDAKVPGVGALKKLLGNVTDQVAGTFLDTHKVESMLAKLKKVLSEGLKGAGAEVHTKIASMLHDLENQLDQSTDKNIVKWKHLSSSAFLAGIPGLTPAQKRELAARFDTVGPGGVVASGSAAFAKAGAVQVHSTINLDGKKVASSVTTHQIRKSKKRTLPRGA